MNDQFTDEEFITFWKNSSAVLQEYPGAMGTHAIKARDEERTFILVAQWESQKHRDAMVADTEAGISERAQRYASYPANDTWGDIQIIMAGTEFDSVFRRPARPKPRVGLGDCSGVGTTEISPQDRDDLLS